MAEQQVDLFISIIPAFVAAWAFYRAVQLYGHAVRREQLFQDNTGEMLHLRFLRLVSLSTAVLAFVLILAKFRYLTLGHHLTEPNEDAIVWAMVDGAVFGVLALLCLHGRQVADATVRAKEVERKNGILKAMIDAAGGFVWIKDAGGRYVFCDNTFCNFFFRMDPSESVVGFTDVELLDAFRKRTKLRHTYGDLCMSTDQHCVERGRKCRYIEVCYIDERLVILDVVKTPLFDADGVCTGTVGMAWERSEDCDHIEKDLVMFKKDGRLIQLCDNVYWVKDRIGDCKWENPLS